MTQRPLSWAQSMREVLLEWYPGGAASLSPHLRQTLHALLTFADGAGVAWVAQERLAAVMGVKPQQVKRRLAELRAAGVVGSPVFRRAVSGAREYGHPIVRPSDASCGDSEPGWLSVVLPGVGVAAGPSGLSADG